MPLKYYTTKLRSIGPPPKRKNAPNPSNPFSESKPHRMRTSSLCSPTFKRRKNRSITTPDSALFQLLLSRWSSYRIICSTDSQPSIQKSATSRPQKTDRPAASNPSTCYRSSRSTSARSSRRSRSDPSAPVMRQTPLLKNSSEMDLFLALLPPSQITPSSDSLYIVVAAAPPPIQKMRMQ